MEIEDIIRANRRAGWHFFDQSTMSFFRSRVGRTIYSGPGGVFFITSEQFVDSRGNAAPRAYTVRRFNPETSDIVTASPFNKISKAAAHRAARDLAAAVPAGA